MEAIFILIAMLGTAYGLGYGTREMISRRRHALARQYRSRAAL